MENETNGLRTSGGIVLLIAVLLAIGGAVPLSSLLFVVGLVLLIAGIAKG